MMFQILRLTLIITLSSAAGFSQTIKDDDKRDWDVFPFINYDQDAGFGYGAKGFLYNLLEIKESYDLTVFQSTGGESWYRFVFSIPDLQRRHKTNYKAAVDLIVDYDKRLYSNYYYDNKLMYSKELEKYTNEAFDVMAVFSTSFSQDVLGEAALRYKSISAYAFEEDGFLQYRYPSHVEYISGILTLRIDKRNDRINPSKGFLFSVNTEAAADILDQDQDFYLIGFEAQTFLEITGPEVVLAERLLAQVMTPDVSYLLQLPIGGVNTIRGLPLDRYLEQSRFLLNSELRFHIWWRFGGIAALDIANLYLVNPVAGLRFYLDNFVVRFDAGFSNEGVSFYANFGHMF
jgi:outer membrane protein assembly factor BamA